MPSNNDTDLVPYETDPALLEAEHDPPSVAHSSPEDEGELDPREIDARKAVRSTLREATWDPKAGIVTLPSYEDGSNHPQERHCDSLKYLVDELRVRAERAWTDGVPGEGSAPLFDFPGNDLVYDVLDEFRRELAKMGWKL